MKFSPAKKRNELAKLVKKDEHKSALIKYYYDKSQKEKEIIEQAEKDLKTLKEEYDSAREGLKELRDEQKDGLNTIVNCCILQLNDAQQKTITSNEARLDRAKARKQRERIRYKGLLEFAKGVAAATIDGVAPQYINAAQEVGNQVMRASQNIIDTCPSKGVEAGSVEQTKLVTEGIVSIVDGVINTYANEDRLQTLKSLSQSDAPEATYNGTRQTVSVGS